MRNRRTKKKKTREEGGIRKEITEAASAAMTGCGIWGQIYGCQNRRSVCFVCVIRWKQAIQHDGHGGNKYNKMSIRDIDYDKGGINLFFFMFSVSCRGECA